MKSSESIEATKSPEMNPIIVAGKSMGEMVANRLSAAVKVGMAVAKDSYHIREVPMEYDTRPPWKYRIHTFANTESSS